jgi:hypothetical protein
MFELDDYVLSQDKAYWRVELCNGDVLHEDDNRPDLTPKSAWLRLKNHCEQYNLAIRKVWLIFRDHVELILDADECLESEGIFFRKGILQGFGGKPSHRYLIGRVIGDLIKIKIWKTPEIILEEEEQREVNNCEESIIWNIALTKN